MRRAISIEHSGLALYHPDGPRPAQDRIIITIQSNKGLMIHIVYQFQISSIILEIRLAGKEAQL